MTLADLPVLNPSTPGREARRSALVALLFLVFGALYALARAAAAAPPDLAASTDPVFGFAYPRGWGLTIATWAGSGAWPGQLAAADLGTALAVTANVILAVALVIVMHPDILSRQGPQYVSPARRITTVIIAFVLAFLVYRGVQSIDQLFSTDLANDPDKARRQLIGLGALSALLFGGLWSFIGPKDFGRRIPLRISHGALGGLAVWAAVSFATMLSTQPRAFLSSSLDTFYTLLTLDAAGGSPGATAGWAVSSDVITAAVAMACAGALLVFTAPQSLGPGNRRGSALVAGILAAAVAVVAGTAYSTTQQRARELAVSVADALQLEKNGGARVPVMLVGGSLPATRKVVTGVRGVPTVMADDCAYDTDNRALPTATLANVRRLAAWLDSQGREINGTNIRAASCRTALAALRWDVSDARAGVFLSTRPERTGPMSYLYAMAGLAATPPAELSRILAALADTTRYQHGSEAAQRFSSFARIAGDTAMEAAWRQRVIEPTGIPSSMLARPAYVDGSITGRIGGRGGWRVGLIQADDPSGGADPLQNAPRNEGMVLASMVAAVDPDASGRFTFTGLRDGYYQLALLAPDGVGAAQLAGITIRNDPGVFRLEPARKTKDLGTIDLNY
jgi:hypothetical protein